MQAVLDSISKRLVFSHKLLFLQRLTVFPAGFMHNG